MELILTMAVGIDDLLRAVFLGHVGEAIAALQDVGGRVVEEHYEAGILLHLLNTVSGIPLSKFSNQLNLVPIIPHPLKWE